MSSQPFAGRNFQKPSSLLRSFHPLAIDKAVRLDGATYFPSLLLYVTFLSLCVTSLREKVRVETLTLCFLVGRVGIEPTTLGLKVPCSTN